MTSRWTTHCATPGREPQSRCRPRQTGDTAELIVSDNGCGLPEEDLSRAAARFWRGQDDGSGTGLGLAIAAEIAAGHGGTISVEKAPEGGLLVRYRLPVAGESTVISDRSAGMSRRAFLLATAAIGCAGLQASEENPADACVWLGRSGRYVSGVRGASGETGSGPLSEHRRRRAPHRGRCREPRPACARRTSIWAWPWPTLPSGIASPAPQQPHL